MFVIGVAGGAHAGKGEVCELILSKLVEKTTIGKKVVILKMEMFYKPLDLPSRNAANQGTYNFDHPDAFDLALFETSVRDILLKKKVSIPEYDFASKSRTGVCSIIQNPDVLIISGIHLLYQKSVRELLNLKVFVDLDPDCRLSAQVIKEFQATSTKVTLESILDQYMNFVKPAYEEFIHPCKKFADVVIPRGVLNHVAIELLTQHIHQLISSTEMTD